MPLMRTSSLPVCRMPSPLPWPVISAEGENTRKYSNGSSKLAPSSKRTSRMRDRVRSLMSVGTGVFRKRSIPRLQDVSRQILIARQIAQAALDVIPIDDGAGAAAIRGIEGQAFQQPLHDGVQAARSDVLGILVHFEGHLGQTPHTGLFESQIDAFRGQQRAVLAAQRGIRFGQNAYEILHHQGFELDANRQAALQLRDQIRGLRHVKGAGCDEQDVIGFHRAVLGVDRAALDQRQKIALYAFARHIRPGGFLAARDLVDFVDENDAVLLGVLDGAYLELLLVDHLRCLLVDQQSQGIFDFQFARTGAVLAQTLEHALQLLGHLLHPRGRHDFHAQRARAHLDLDLAIVEFAFAQHFSETLPRIAVARPEIGCRPRSARQERIENALLGGIRRAMAHFRNLFFSGHFNGDVDKIAYDRVHFSTNITYFCEFSGLNLDERSLGEPRQPPRDLGLSDARGADHENVLRGDLGAQIFRHLTAPPAIAQGNGDGTFGRFLPDDVLVELLDDFTRSHLRHGRYNSSMVRLRLV